ncbi:MAG: hypothetical protein LBE05_03680 [Microbacterium sp.]|jgi:hypothetical protein|nr:hypothetical protein [Microbacterium sp.]
MRFRGTSRSATVLAGGLVVSTMLLTLTLTGCGGWSISPVVPTASVEGTGDNSSLSDAGAAQIERTGSARFDWSSGPLLLEDVGLTGAGDFANGVPLIDGPLLDSAERSQTARVSE